MEGGGKNHLLTVSEDHADGEHRKLSRSISIREGTLISISLFGINPLHVFQKFAIIFYQSSPNSQLVLW
jgi:hypothetical protein